VSHNNAFELCKKRRYSQKQEIFHGFGVGEIPLIIQAGCSDCIYFSLSLFFSVVHLKLPSTFLYFTVPHRSSAQIFCREETCNSIVALGPLEPQKSTQLISISRNFASFEKLSWKVTTRKCLFQSSAFVGTREVEDCQVKILFGALGFMAFGRRGLSIEEVDDCCESFRRAQ
jgi:hypothetical protein